MSTNFGFDAKALLSATKQAETEALKVFHYGHVPEMTPGNQHGSMPTCSASVCKMIAASKKAAKHIEQLDALPSAVKHILETYQGYEVVHALTELVKAWETKTFTLSDTWEFIHEDAPIGEDDCTCSDCIEAKANKPSAKKFALEVAADVNQPVTSVKSLVEAAPGSQVKVFGTTTFTKLTTGKWTDKLEGKYESSDFVGVVQGKSIKWLKHKAVETPDSEPASDDDVTPSGPWLQVGKIVTVDDLEMAPPGAAIHEYNDPHTTAFGKTEHGYWQILDSSTGVFFIGGYESKQQYGAGAFNYGKWVWKAPVKGTPCAELKAKADSFKKKEAAKTKTDVAAKANTEAGVDLKSVAEAATFTGNATTFTWNSFTQAPVQKSSFKGSSIKTIAFDEIEDF